ncbi:hypothetical protein GCM10010909_25000 [Acidocella aquatica]|uniref:Uncharacterized protein n=2 Tax=Acidocella aquatica TaxID=1922313 RepID=A0ABQ6A6K9_9PROT|nr:hypothetical protein GCM10010909_25000 [Acidocella aquatica]
MTSENEEKLSEYFWPNDEGFTATKLFEAGFKIADMNSLGRIVYTAKSLYEGPFSPKKLAQLGHDNLIYHHVFTGKEYTRRALKSLEWENIAMSSTENFYNRFHRPDIYSSLAEEDSFEGIHEYIIRFSEILLERAWAK